MTTQKSKMYRVFGKAEENVIKEANRRTRTTKRNHTLQEVLNSMLEEYPQLMRRINTLDK